MTVYRLRKNWKLPAVKDFIKDSVLRETYEEEVVDYKVLDILVTY